MKKRIHRDIKNRISHTFETSDGNCFYLMVHYCGELLLCSTDELGACRLDAAVVGKADGRDGLWILKYGSREPKINISALSEDDIALLLEQSGISVSPDLYFESKNKKKPGRYEIRNDVQSPMMRSVLTWAKKHPRFAKEEYCGPLIEQVRRLVKEPMPIDQYTGF